MRSQYVKVGVLFAVLLVWAATMVYWIFVKHIAPDPITWGVPQGIWLMLYPNGFPRGSRREDE